MQPDKYWLSGFFGDLFSSVSGLFSKHASRSPIKVGILQRLKAAKTAHEADSLLSSSKGYVRVSADTKRKWLRAHAAKLAELA